MYDRTNEERKQAHYQLLQQLNTIIGIEDKNHFQLTMDEFEKGLNDSAFYNRCLRRLCTSSHEKIPLLLVEIYKLRFVLNISPTETNKDKLSALDYAKINNPQAYKLMLELQKEEYNQLTHEMGEQLINKFFGIAYPFPRVTPLVLNKEEKAQMDNTTTQVSQKLAEMLPRLLNIHDMNPESADRKVRGEVFNMVKTLFPNRPVSETPLAHDSKALLPELEQIANGDLATIPFMNFCKAGEYAKALWFATECTNQSLVAKLVDRLLDYSQALELDINKIKNEEGQTIQHKAALSKEARASGWILYYTLGGKGANSFLPDNHNKTPGDYRRQMQMNFIYNTGQNPITPVFKDMPGIDPKNCIVS